MYYIKDGSERCLPSYRDDADNVIMGAAETYDVCGYVDNARGRIHAPGHATTFGEWLASACMPEGQRALLEGKHATDAPFLHVHGFTHVINRAPNELGVRVRNGFVDFLMETLRQCRRKAAADAQAAERERLRARDARRAEAILDGLREVPERLKRRQELDASAAIAACDGEAERRVRARVLEWEPPSVDKYLSPSFQASGRYTCQPLIFIYSISHWQGCIACTVALTH